MCKVCHQKNINNTLSYQFSRAIVERGKTWTKGDSIFYLFLEGTDYQKNRIKRALKIWTDLRPQLKVVEVRVGEYSDVRISFLEYKGSWSFVGTDNHAFSQYNQVDATMNIGWDDGQILATELHEIGHLFGLLHEHQSPLDNPFEWLIDIIYKDMAGQGWTKAEVDWNIINRYSANTHNGTNYDDNSIMRYAFPARWNKQGIKTKWNTELSHLDKAYFRTLYSENTLTESIDLDVIRAMFPTQKSICKMLEPSVVALANGLGLKATTRDKEKDTAKKIFESIHKE